MKARIATLLGVMAMTIWYSTASQAANQGDISASARKKGMKAAPELIKNTGITCTLTDARLIETRTRSSFAGAAMSVNTRSAGGGGPGGGPPGGGGGGGGGGDGGDGGGGSSPRGNGPTSTQYELACSEGLGYLITMVNKTPDAVNCLEQNDLANAAAMSPAGGQGAPAGGMGGSKGGMQPAQPSCILPGNANPMSGLSPYLAKANVPCTPARARGIGRTTNSTLFEVACNDDTGYLLATTRNPDPAQEVQAINCADLDQTGKVQCTLTDPRTALKIADQLMAQSERSCAVVDRRVFGSNDAGEKFYEVSCVDGAGYVIQQMPDGTLGQTVPCADIGDMAGGCQLAANKP